MSGEDEDRPATDGDRPEARGVRSPSEKTASGGYKKIDRKYCWPKGKSGNPSGKKRLTPTFDDYLDKAMRAKVTATENGRRTKKSREQLSAIRLANESCQNTKTALSVAERRRRRREQEHLLHGSGEILAEDDQALIDAYFLRNLARFQTSLKPLAEAAASNVVMPSVDSRPGGAAPRPDAAEPAAKAQVDQSPEGASL